MNKQFFFLFINCSELLLLDLKQFKKNKLYDKRCFQIFIKLFQQNTKPYKCFKPAQEHIISCKNQYHIAKKPINHHQRGATLPAQKQSIEMSKNNLTVQHCMQAATSSPSASYPSLEPFRHSLSIYTGAVAPRHCPVEPRWSGVQASNL